MYKKIDGIFLVLWKLSLLRIWVGMNCGEINVSYLMVLNEVGVYCISVVIWIGVRLFFVVGCVEFFWVNC